MGTFDWQGRYSCADGDIDTEHKMLLRLAEDLHQSIVLNKGDKVCKLALDALAAYTSKHFAHEEDLFRRRSCALLDDHIAQHERLRAELMSLWQDTEMKLVDNAAETLDDWVTTRLVNHMVEDDQQALRACAS